MEHPTKQHETSTTSSVPTHQPARTYRPWLPTPGNVIFTLFAIFVLLGAQSAGALPLSAPLAADALPSRGMISYQGQLTDTNNQPINGPQRMRFALYDSATATTSLWEEEWSDANAIQLADGQFNDLLGSQNPIKNG